MCDFQDTGREEGRGAKETDCYVFATAAVSWINPESIVGDVESFAEAQTDFLGFKHVH